MLEELTGFDTGSARLCAMRYRIRARLLEIFCISSHRPGTALSLITQFPVGAPGYRG